jgi:ABC-type glycerol-3-phosphate transport system substrate-binding protein
MLPDGDELGGGEEGMTKKQLFKCLFPAALLGMSVLIMAGCGSSESTKPADETKTFTSTTVEGHAHTVTLKKSDIQGAPAEGISMNTSSASGHTHTFRMTKAQTESISKSMPVTITTSTDSGHSHDFAISNWWWL